jgi:serine/threonine-protein kinase HipA
MAKEILVHIDLKGKPLFVGRMWIHAARGRESATFEYSREWLESPFRFPLEPALNLGIGPFHTNKAIFGSIGDTAPDRWGRVLMDRREARRAKSENRHARNLSESDYLLMVNDLTRQGALRFSEKADGPFLASDPDVSIPPLVHLQKLLNASDRIQAFQERDEDIRELVAPGSSLGGARPKASVLDTDGKLLIAKFPSGKDEWDVVLWEFLSLRMAGHAGIPVPGFRLEKVAGNNVLLLERFDRHEGGIRVPFLSAMSMLGASDHEHGSYLEIAEALKEYGSRSREDLKDLWRRMVLNILISNVDDHLRNHGFLYDGASGWRLSPVYDLEPTPEHIKPRVLHTNIDLHVGSATLELALDVAGEFGLSTNKAKEIIKEVGQAASAWDKEALRFGAGKEEIEQMRSAFDHHELEKALRL